MVVRYQQPTLEPQVLEHFSVVNESLLDAHETKDLFCLLILDS